jgi:predicted ATPase
MQSREHFDQALTLYGSVEHPRLARVEILAHKSWVLWALGYPESGLADAEVALRSARAMGHAPESGLADAEVALRSARATDHAQTWLATLVNLEKFHLYSGNYAAAAAALNELSALADEKGAFAWKTGVNNGRGRLNAFMGKPSEAIQMLTPGLADAAQRSTGTTMFQPLNLLCLAHAHAELGQFDEAWRRIGEAITTLETTKEKLLEAEIYRTAGEIALRPSEPNAVQAEVYFGSALKVARQQQAKSWELRAAMSMARLWRSQGKQQQARELLASAYGWFTEGFDTRDLKEAKALLDTLASEALTAS